MNNLYKIGEWVRVKHPGNTYNTYKEKFDELGVGYVSTENDIHECHTFSVGDIVYIYNIGEHALRGRVLYAISDCIGRESLIGEDGLERAEKRREFVAGQHDISYDPDIGHLYLNWYGTLLETEVLIITNPVTGNSVEFGPVPGFRDQWRSDSGLTTITNDGVFHKIKWRV